MKETSHFLEFQCLLFTKVAMDAVAMRKPNDGKEKRITY